MKPNSFFEKILLLAFGTVGIAFSGLNWHIGIAAWIAPIFLLLFTRKAKWYEMIVFFLFMSIAGAVSQTGNNFMNLVSVHVFNGLSFGVLYTMAFLLDRIIYRKKDKFYYTLVFPAIFVLMEFLLNPIFGTWGSIAHTQFEFKPFVQLSSVIGIYGMSFMVFWFSSVICWIIEKKDQRKDVYKGSIIYGVALAAVVLYGLLRLNIIRESNEKVKVATVISDLDAHEFASKEQVVLKKLSEDYSLEIPAHIFSDSVAIESMIERTKIASFKGANIVVWNEIALILSQKQKKSSLAKIQSFCKNSEVYVLLSFLEEDNRKGMKPFNNVSILVSSKGKVLWDYKKSFVHPVAEAPIINEGDYKIPFAETEYGVIGSVICSDLDITNYIKQAGVNNMDILLVPAYDWEGITPLHPQMACTQAVQFGFSMVRSNGCGISTICDFKGKEIASLNTFELEDKMLIAEVPISGAKTVYSQIGEVFVYLIIVFMFFIIVKRFAKQK